MTLSVRSPRPADAAAVVELGNAFERAMSGEPDEWTETDLLREWRELGDLERDAWLVERDGAAAGYATLRDDGDGRLDADGYVHPDHIGNGVGGRLIDLTEARAAELASGSTEPKVVLRNAVLHADARARALLEARGYRTVRSFLRMRIDMDGPPPAPQWPAGVTPSAFRPGIDEAAVHACVNESFAQEWSHQPETLAEWSARKFSDPRFDPGLWLIARDGDEVCGVALSTPGQFEIGFVNALGVRAPWRKRGLGLALLHGAFGLFWERGEHRVGLGVDSDNPTGARKLYERAGMHAAWQADVYEKGLRG
jgi:mycothiol synthase